MELDYGAIGERIRAKRKAMGWSQAHLAELSGIEPSNISHIERGATKLSLPTLVHIANALGMSLDEIVCGSLIKSGHVSVKFIDALLADCTAEELRAIEELLATFKRILRSR